MAASILIALEDLLAMASVATHSEPSASWETDAKPEDYTITVVTFKNGERRSATLLAQGSTVMVQIDSMKRMIPYILEQNVCFKYIT